MNIQTILLYFIAIVALVVIEGCAFASEKKAPYVKKRETIYYKVHGKTPRELIRSIQAKGPYNEMHKRRWFGYTDIEFSYGSETTSTLTECKLSDLQVNFTVKVTLPSWQDEPFGTERARKWWDEMIERLKLHEEGHVIIAENYLPVVYERLHAVQPEPTCEALQKKLDAVYADVGNEMQKQQIAYDKKTQHGKRQNGYLPIAK